MWRRNEPATHLVRKLLQHDTEAVGASTFFGVLEALLADVVPLAVGVVDVVLGLVEGAVHACGRADERVCAGLVGGELSIDGESATVS